MATAIMDLIGDDHRASARKRMEWVGDLDLASQTPGIMTSRRMAAPTAAAACTP